MAKATGQIAVVNGRDGKFGKMWSFKLEGEDTWYGSKSVRPNCNEGDVVEFSWANNKRGYPDADLGTLVVLEGGAVVAETPAAQEAVAEGRKSYDRKQAVIVYQNAGNRAIEFTRLAMDAELVDLPKKGTVAERYQALRMFVDLATNDFYYESMDVFAGNEPGEDA